jgi:hypothetical protein|tara:strand:- start:199 stop:1236 length:1038 start_codon:yes stop_codon:yes gene_type:complete
MASNTTELLPILKALREYIVKEYGVNYPPHVRGEDATGKDLPSDWVGKLNPLSGGDTVGRDSHGSQGTKSSKAAAQGTDPYLHKSDLEAILADFAKHMVDGQPVQAGGPRADGMHGAGGYSYPGEGQNDNRGLAKDHHEEEEEDMMEDGVEDIVDNIGEDSNGEDDFLGEDDEEVEDMEKNYMARSADGVNALLKDIKGLLSSRQQEKQEYTAIQAEISGLKKSVNAQVRDGIKSGLKQFNLNPSRGDTMTPLTKEGSSILGSESEDQTSFEMPDRRIGVEGDSFQKSAEEEGQEQFVNGIEEITSRTDASDLRGHFKLVNGMRNQTGELTPHTLYYYPTKGGRK